MKYRIDSQSKAAGYCYACATKGRLAKGADVPCIEWGMYYRGLICISDSPVMIPHDRWRKMRYLTNQDISDVSARAFQ